MTRWLYSKMASLLATLNNSSWSLEQLHVPSQTPESGQWTSTCRHRSSSDVVYRPSTLQRTSTATSSVLSSLKFRHQQLDTPTWETWRKNYRLSPSNPCHYHHYHLGNRQSPTADWTRSDRWRCQLTAVWRATRDHGRPATSRTGCCSLSWSWLCCWHPSTWFSEFDQRHNVIDVSSIQHTTLVNCSDYDSTIQDYSNFSRGLPSKKQLKTFLFTKSYPEF